jgi:hypothetical protein
MDPSEARQHLDLVDRILTETDRSMCVIGDVFVVWGLVAAGIDVTFQLALTGRAPGWWQWLPLALIPLGIAYTIVRSIQAKNSSDRLTTVGREYLNVVWVVFGLMAVAQTAAFHLFPGWSAAALWTLAGAIITFYVGMHGNRAGMLGGIVLLASLIVASFVPAYCGWILAGGMVLGYTGFGVASMVRGD